MANETVSSIEELEAIYGVPSEASIVKVASEITNEYARYIELSPFLALATAGPEGLDCSPRGDQRGFVRIANSKQLMLPDRRGNNRIDSLRNIVRDPRVALLIFVPGSQNTLRVNGRAQINTSPDLLDSFSVNKKAPRSVIVIDVDEVYFQCGRAILRSELWNSEHHGLADQLPTPGTILACLSEDQVGGEKYDREWPGKAKETLW